MSVHVEQAEITLLLVSHQVSGKRFFFPPPKLMLHGDGGFQKANSCLCPRAKAMGLLEGQEFLFSIFLLCLKQLAAFRSSYNVIKRKRRVQDLQGWKRGREVVVLHRGRWQQGQDKTVHSSNAFGKIPMGYFRPCRIHTALIGLEAIQHRYKSKSSIKSMYNFPEFAKSFVSKCPDLSFVMDISLTYGVANTISKISLIKPL